MRATVLVCGKIFDGTSEELTGPAEILVAGSRIESIGRSINRPPGTRVIDLSDRTVSPGFIEKLGRRANPKIQYLPYCMLVSLP